jgi:GMP synthase-like glutamine amidotransferase
VTDGRERPRRALFLRHHIEDDPGLVGDALFELGFVVDLCMVEDGSPAPDLDGVDLLAVLGSKWSVYDHDAVGGWIATELDLIREADRRGIPVLGICFGAQALCAAFGGTVEPAPAGECGWVEIAGDAAAGIPSGPWFEFHGDHCLVPEIATVVARNEVCVQAFTIGPHLGVQFHPEIDAAQLSRWLAHGDGDAARAMGASPEDLLRETAEREAEAAVRVAALVGSFVAARFD